MGSTGNRTSHTQKLSEWCLPFPRHNTPTTTGPSTGKGEGGKGPHRICKMVWWEGEGRRKGRHGPRRKVWRLMACQVIFRVEMQRSMSCDTHADCLLALVSCCFWGKEQKNQGLSAPVVFRMNSYQCRHLLMGVAWGIQGHDHAPFWIEEW